jgi:hypothetical protein
MRPPENLKRLALIRGPVTYHHAMPRRLSLLTVRCQQVGVTLGQGKFGRDLCGWSHGTVAWLCIASSMQFANLSPTSPSFASAPSRDA